MLYNIGLREIVLTQNIWFTSISLILFAILLIINVFSIFTYVSNPSFRKKEREREKPYWLVSSLAAAICEEFVWRGVLFFLLQSIFPNIPILVLLATTAVIYGIKHARQGVKGVAVNTFGGVISGALLLVTGSIIPGMILRFINNVSRIFPLANNRPDNPSETQENIVEYSEIIEGFEYIRKEIDWSEKIEKIAPLVFSVSITIICLILFHLISPESIISVLVNTINGFQLIYILVLIALVAINFLSIGVHELLHAVFFAPFQKNGFKSTKIGSNHMGYFCETKDPIKVKHYIIGLVAPTIVMGVIPIIIAIATGNIFLLLFGWWMTIGGNGDFMILLNVLKYSKNTWLLVAASEEEMYYYQPKF